MASLPARRVVLVGASNLTRGIGMAVETACRVWGRPLDVLAAFGHGRSYGMRMSLLGRELPGLVDCGLWEALRRRPPAPTAALVTDIGNDLLFEVGVPEIAGWVRTCLDRLREAGARMVMTRLPLEGLQTLSPAKYLFLRTILFPFSRIALATVRERAHELDRRLQDLAAERNVCLVPHQAAWYGFDPIHIKMRHWAQAWRAFLAPWANAAPLPEPAQASFSRWLYLRRLAPEVRWFFGREFRHAQPAGRLPDGSTLSFY
jgi:hypothetical protein